MTLTPAYGRDYKSKAEVLADFDANKDFIISDPTSRWDGKPVNKEQMKRGDIVSFRFARLKRIFEHQVPA